MFALLQKPLHHEDVAKLYPHHAFGDYSSKLAAKRVDLQQERASLIARTNILRCNVHTLGVTANKVRILKELADLWSSPRLSLYCADEQFEPCGSRIMQSLVCYVFLSCLVRMAAGFTTHQPVLRWCIRRSE